MICAGTALNPMQCGEAAVTIISGFSMCQKHANEVALRYRMLVKQLEKRRAVQTAGMKKTDPDLVPSMSIKDLTDLQMGAWKNIKNTT